MITPISKGHLAYAEDVVHKSCGDRPATASSPILRQGPRQEMMVELAYLWLAVQACWVEVFVKVVSFAEDKLLHEAV